MQIIFMTLFLAMANINAMEVKSPEIEKRDRFIIDFSNTADCPPLSLWLMPSDNKDILELIDENGGFITYPRGRYLPRINVQRGRHFRISLNLNKTEISFPLALLLTAHYQGAFSDHNGFNEYNPHYKLFLKKSYHDKTIMLDYEKEEAIIDGVNICNRTDWIESIKSKNNKNQ